MSQSHKYPKEAVYCPPTSEFYIPHFKPCTVPTPLMSVKYISDIDTVLLDPSRFDFSNSVEDSLIPVITTQASSGAIGTTASTTELSAAQTPFQQSLPPHSPYLKPLDQSELANPSVLNLSPAVDLVSDVKQQPPPLSLIDAKIQMAGPRKKLFFNPVAISCGIVTCGGVCPGLNNVSRSLVSVLWYRYGVRRILGFKYGYLGLTPQSNIKPVDLTPDYVKDIHQFGGTILGTSRGPQEPSVMLDYLIQCGVDVLFCIGGDGTQKGAHAIALEAAKRNVLISVIGIGKTIDNDLLYLDKSFGFDTAVQLAQQAIIAAHEEARAVQNGIGIVKLMGRESGALALNASLASGDVNVVLIPEVEFQLRQLVEYLRDRFKTRDHCLIVCAEGAGQNLVGDSGRTDKSGNKVFNDIGEYLKENLSKELKALKIQHTVKYIDPSYSIRAGVANSSDSILCTLYAQMAAHAAMAGKTDMMVGMLNGRYVHLPLSKVTQGKKNVDVLGFTWQGFLDATGGPFS
jgi:6-phosphofructokinase 1